MSRSPFHSGRLTYDCITCGSKCCRGHGFLIRNGPELERQLSRRPHLVLFLRKAEKPDRSYLVSNCPPGCFFLNQNGLCDIESDDGHDAKPETCRLFPFNDLHVVGDYLIVRPHPSLCPLAIVPRDASDVRSDYCALLRELTCHGISAAVSEVRCIHRDIAAVIALERAITLRSEELPSDVDYRWFAAEQLRATETLVAPPAAVPPCSDDASPRIEQFMSTVHAMMGLPADVAETVDPDLDRVMVALTPYLRSTVIFPDPQLQFTTRFLRINRVPYVLLAIRLIASLARLSGMRDITFQTVARLALGNMDLIDPCQ